MGLPNPRNCISHTVVPHIFERLDSKLNGHRRRRCARIDLGFEIFLYALVSFGRRVEVLNEKYKDYT